MNTMRPRHLLLFLIAGMLMSSASAGATFIPHPDFERVWSRLDLPVASGSVDRTWYWGPSPISGLIEEDYLDAARGKRLVVYFDKSRMELNEAAPEGSAWRITNGLLATELVTGKLQLGDNAFASYYPAEVNVAGDPDDPTGPTYKSFKNLLSASALPEGTVITQTIDRHGNVGHDESTAQYGVTAKHFVASTGHAVASVFWKYMNSSGMIHVDGADYSGLLFDNPFYGTGYPIAEAYWTRVRVAGVEQPVLIQVFQRRVLTYTPHNPDGWKVEAGNVGQHYWSWRIDLGDLSAHFETSSNSSSNENCEQHSENVSENGTVRQSNSSTVTNNGNSTVTCSQTNITIQSR